MIVGLEPRLFYAVGGRPSAGKSAFGQSVAVNLAVYQKVPTGLISIESSAEEVYGRFYSNLARVEGRRIRSGFLSNKDFEAIRTAEAAIASAPLYLWDKPNASFREIRGIARYMVRTHGIKVLIVDYLQIVKWPGAKDRIEAAANVSTGLKEIAREFNIAVLALAQLGRQVDERKPGMGDFQWASQIEQDADVGLLLWHTDSADSNSSKSYIIVAKAREGRTGTVPVLFERDFIRYCDIPDQSSMDQSPGKESPMMYRD
jgi:replicative DNA helicase